MTTREADVELGKGTLGSAESVLEFLRRCQSDRRLYIETFFRIQSRDRRYQRFRLNRVQEEYWKTRTHRDLYLKARQVTVSSIIQADLTAEAMLNPGINAMIVVQKPEQQTLRYHRNRIGTFVSSVPKALRPKVEVDNDHQLTFSYTAQTGERYLSNIYFASAGSEAVGRGETLHRIHITEFASWEEAEADAMMDTLLGLPKSSRVCIESSPHGAAGPLFDMWRAAKRGDGSFTPHLFQWWWEESYRREATAPSPQPAYSEYETRLMGQFGLTPEQIAWRRHMVREAESRWGEDAEKHFLQEYLEDDVSCFLLAGSPVFDTLYIERLRQEARRPVSEQNGLRVWLAPEAGETYVIGADPAEGLAESNLSAAIVRKSRTWEHVATLRGHIPPKDFAGRLSELALRYNGALVCVERNNHGHAVLMALTDLFAYPRLYLHLRDVAVGGDDLLGHPTNMLTKPTMVAAQQQLVATRLWSSWDEELLEQMRQYEEVEGRYGADEDDLVMADTLALAARSQAMLMTGIRRAPTVRAGW